ncbi:MAG: hypothetical protein ACOZNI_36275 [Myxococcota bacterium]
MPDPLDVRRREILAAAGLLFAAPAAAATPPVSAERAAVRAHATLARERSRRVRELALARTVGAHPDAAALGEHVASAFGALVAVDTVLLLSPEQQAAPEVQRVLADASAAVATAVLGMRAGLAEVASRVDPEAFAAALGAAEQEALALAPSGRSRRRLGRGFARMREQLARAPAGEVLRELLARMDHVEALAAGLREPGARRRAFGPDHDATEARLLAAGAAWAAADPDTPGADPEPSGREAQVVLGALLLGLGITAAGVLTVLAIQSLYCPCLAILLLLGAGAAFALLGGPGILLLNGPESRPEPRGWVTEVTVPRDGRWTDPGIRLDAWVTYHLEAEEVEIGSGAPTDGSPTGNPLLDAGPEAPAPGLPLGAVVARTDGRDVRLVGRRLALRGIGGALELAVNEPASASTRGFLVRIHEIARV